MGCSQHIGLWTGAACYMEEQQEESQTGSCIAGKRRSGETMRVLVGLCNSLTFTWRWSQRRDLSRRVSGCNLYFNVLFCQVENRPHLGIVKLMYFCNNYVLCLNIKFFLSPRLLLKNFIFFFNLTWKGNRIAFPIICLFVAKHTEKLIGQHSGVSYAYQLGSALPF